MEEIERLQALADASTNPTLKSAYEARIVLLLSAPILPIVHATPATPLSASGSPGPSSKHRCPVEGCGMELSSTQRLRSHLTSKNCYGNKTPCPECDDEEVRYTEAGLKKHLADHARERKDQEKADKAAQELAEEIAASKCPRCPYHVPINMKITCRKARVKDTAMYVNIHGNCCPARENKPESEEESEELEPDSQERFDQAVKLEEDMAKQRYEAFLARKAKRQVEE